MNSVYIFGSSETGPLKIGFSVHPEGRLAALQGGHPYKLKIMRTWQHPQAYAVENFRLAGDTILTDPVLRDHDVSASAIALSDDLQASGCIHASMAHAAQNIAAAIRAAIGDQNAG